MFVLKYIVLFLILFLLYLLYRYLPNRRIFVIFCLTLAGAGAFAFFSYQKPADPVISEADKYEIQQQQQIFSKWYDEYKKSIDQLEHNWQQYHNILENFKEDNISIQTTYVRLTQLEKEAAAARERIARLAPPTELNNTNYDLVTAVQQKTEAYANAQYRAISKTKTAADPAQLLTDKQDEQSRLLEETMIRESPTGLFTASEIAALRDNLTLPSEQ